MSFFDSRILTLSPSLIEGDVENDKLKKIGQGTFNTVYKMLINNDNKNNKKYCVVHKPKKSNIDDSALTFYHVKLFSEVVKQNIFPHFPILFNYKRELKYNHKCESSSAVYTTFQEYCDLGDLFHQIDKLSNTKIKNVMTQVILTSIFMNKTLKLSHNDLTLSNIILKKIKSQYITYIYKKKKITLHTNILAITTDFDKTRGIDTSYNNTFYDNTSYDNTYIIEHYQEDYIKILKSLRAKQKYIDVVNNVCKIIIESNNGLYYDIGLFLLSTFVTSFDINDTITKISYKFMKKYFIKQKKLFYCIEKYLFNNNSDKFYNHHHLNKNPKNIFYINSSSFDYSELSFKNNKLMYHDLFMNENVRGYFLNHFIIEEFNINHFIKNVNENENNDGKMIKRRKILLDWIDSVVKKTRSNAILKRINLIKNIIDYVNSKYEIPIKQYQLLGATVFYLCVNDEDDSRYDIDLKFIRNICAEQYSIDDIKSMILKILKILNK